MPPSADPRPLRDFAVPRGCEPAAVGGGGLVAAARWTPVEIAAVAGRLAARGAAALAALTLERRIELWLEVTEALLDPESEERRALMPALVATSRLSAEGLSEALGVIVGGARESAVETLVARLGEAATRAPAAVVLAANVPALAVQTMLPALLLGRPLLVRSSSREPLAAAALVGALTRREPALAEAFAALTWRGEAAELEEAAFAGAERIVAYGGAAAIAGLAARWGDRLVAHGPRASLALVAGVHDPLGVARALARDVSLLDQRGCLSVQAVYVTGDPRPLGEALAFALEAEGKTLPPGPVDAATAAAVQQMRGEAALRDALLSDLELATGTVVTAPDARFAPVPGLRSVRLHAIAAPDEAGEALAPWRGRLQGMAWAGEEGEAAARTLASPLGLARIAAAGRLQHAEAGWASGGIDPLAALG